MSLESGNENNQEESKIQSAAQRLNDIDSRLEGLEAFITRRFDEIAAEINATSQQVDMAEEGFTKRFSEIFEVINAISHQGEGATQDNAGVELEAVVSRTEEAANKIIDSADNISEYLKDSGNWDEPEHRQKMLSAIDEEVQNIMLACEFQDITSQRIHKALEHIHRIEEHLGSTARRLGIDVDDIQQQSMQASQEMVQENTKASQDDIDKMFE